MALVLFMVLFLRQSGINAAFSGWQTLSLMYSLPRIQSLLHQEDSISCAGFVYGAASTKNMSQLYFGTRCFTPAQTKLIPEPIFSQSLLTPKISSHEIGALFTLWAKKYVSDYTALGARILLPIRSIKENSEWNQNYFQLSRASRVIEQNVNMLLRERPQVGVAACEKQRVGGSCLAPCAYRLDTLSQLPYSYTGIGASYPIVQYHDSTFVPTSPVTIYNQDVTNAQNSPVTVISVPVGALPEQPYALAVSQVPELPALPASGALATGERAFFSDTIDYTPLASNTAAQEQLWVVPTYEPILLPQDKELLSQAGFNFTGCSKKAGLGTVITEFFWGYHASDKLYTELIAGIGWPTGNRYNPAKILQPVLGTNGHYLIQLEWQAFYTLTSWLAFRPDVSYHWALNKKEYIALPLKNSPVTGFGVIQPASTSWQYGAVNADLLCTLKKIHSTLYFGYGFYGKRETHIHVSQAVREQYALDLLEAKSSATAQVVHAALFNEQKDWLELVAAASYTCAGKRNAKPVVGSLGITFYF